MIVLYYLERVNCSRGKRHGEGQWQKNIGKQCPKRSKREQSQIHRAQMAEWRKVSRISESSWMDRRKFADTWTTSRRSTSATAQPGTSGTGTKTPSSWYPMMMIAKLDWCEREPSHLHWQLLRIWQSCEELSWNHCTSTPHRSETNGIAEWAVRGVKEGTSAVPLQSGLDNEWWADSMECYTYLRNIQDLLSDRKSPCERRFGMPFNGTVIPFGSMVEYHPISAKDQSRLHQFGSQGYPPDMH